MNDIIRTLSLIGIVPVVQINDAAGAKPLAKALADGGLPCAEVTFRTSAAAASIAAMTEAYPDMLVGAGTVLTVKQVDEAVSAGAKFIVSPGLNPEVVRYCVEKGIPMIPGINNPSGIEQALSLGLDVVKFFPAEQSGGIAMLKAMSAPYGGVKFMPTGGVNAANLNNYLSNPKVLCCGGSWMVKPDLLAKGDYETVTRLTREAVDCMLGFTMRHVGINSASREAAESNADLLGRLFSFAKDVRTASFFAGTGVEIMNGKGRGTMGHIAIGTNSVDRAMYHLGRRGVTFDMTTAQYDENGACKFVYLADEINGFAYHLVR